MTDRKQTLTELREKVAAGDDSGFRMANRAVFSTPCQDMNLQLREENCRHAYKGSLDAALALHNAVLPGWLWRQHFNGKTHCHTTHRNIMAGEFAEAEHEEHASISCLLAILSALIAQEGDL